MPHHVLVVDDEPNVLNAIRRCLMEEEDFSISLARGPDEAWEVLSIEPVDVTISDHDMPKMTGLDFLESVRTKYPDTMRIMASGRADLKLALEAVNAETIYRFIAKPWEDTELRLMIRLALKHRDDQRRVRELSRIVATQASLFARIIERHPDCKDLVEQYLFDLPDSDREPATI